MKENQVGEILFELRMEQGIRQELLGYGLCSKAALSRYESGERVPDRLLLNRLLQRLGKDADKMATILSREEYDYLLWKKQILKALIQKEKDKVGKLLEYPEALQIKVNETLQLQFYYQIRAFLAEWDERPAAYCEELYQKAVEFTLPKLKPGELERYPVSMEELQLLVGLARQQQSLGEEEKAVALLLEITDYAKWHYRDPEARVKIYPKAVRILAPLLREKGRYSEGMQYSKEAIELLCYNGLLVDLTELMEEYLLCSEKAGDNGLTDQYQKQLWALKEVYAEYSGERSPDNKSVVDSLFTSSNQEIYLINEVIRLSRLSRELSQEELSDNICSPETLSRIESGKRAPNSRNFYAIMERLEEDIDYYNGELNTTDYRLLEKMAKLKRAISLYQWEEAEKLLEELKTSLNMSDRKNAQELRKKESCILFNMGKIDMLCFRDICLQLLGCEGEEWREEKFWKPFLTVQRAYTLNYLAGTYFKEGKTENAIFIMEHILEKLEQSRVNLEDRPAVSFLTILNLASCYGRSGRKEECIRLCKKGVNLWIDSGEGKTLPSLLQCQARVLTETGQDKEKAKLYFKQAYYLYDLYDEKKMCENVEAYCKDHYDYAPQWDS